MFLSVRIVSKACVATVYEYLRNLNMYEYMYTYVYIISMNIYGTQKQSFFWSACPYLYLYLGLYS
jgi:hypothetical protein